MPMNMSRQQAEAFGRIRAQWMSQMDPLDDYLPSELFEPLVLPPSAAFDHCRVFCGRAAGIQSLRLPKGGRVAEVGTQEGRFLRVLWDALQPAELHAFDMDFAPFWEAGDLALQEVATVHEGDSSTALSAFPRDYFDLIYIDGDHSYEGVKRDVEVAITRVRPGGYLVFNDFTIWSPVECLDYGVPYVVCELLNDQGWPATYLALEPLGYHDIAVQRPLGNEGDKG